MSCTSTEAKGGSATTGIGPDRTKSDLVTRTRVILVAGFVLLAVLAAGVALYRAGDAQPPEDLTVGWGASEGHPSCVYDPKDQTVRATLAIEGDAGPGRTVTVTVMAYADENTSEPVGSGSRAVRVDGPVNRRLVVAFPVENAPKVDIDGETACRLAVRYGGGNQSK